MSYHAQLRIWVFLSHLLLVCFTLGFTFYIYIGILFLVDSKAVCFYLLIFQTSSPCGSPRGYYKKIALLNQSYAHQTYRKFVETAILVAYVLEVIGKAKISFTHNMKIRRNISSK
jgi:hypothetical protein